MTIETYQNAAWNSYMGRELPLKEQLINHALGLVGESGEVADQVKKEYYIGRDISREETVEELGDVLWHLCCSAAAKGVTMQEVMSYNLEKLKRRYPNAEW